MITFILGMITGMVIGIVIVGIYAAKDFDEHLPKTGRTPPFF